MTHPGRAGGAAGAAGARALRAAAAWVLAAVLLGGGGRAGSAPASWSLSVAPEEVGPGEFVAATLAGPALRGGPEGWSGELAGQRFGFYPAGPDRAVALVALAYHLRPGTYTLTVQGPGGERAERAVKVHPRAYPLQRLTVPPSKEALVRPQDPATARRLQQEQAAVDAARARSSPRPLWEGAFVWPLEGPLRITSEFGLIREINGRITERHSGLDLAAPAGTPVRAANAGQVVLARALLATGNTVIVDHGWGLFTSYLHLRTMVVHEGQTVRKGQLLGEVGATGFATGPHLHWAAWLPGGFVDPRLLLEAARWPPALSWSGN
ncbi:MAG TPA: M23 family metallopeptidase [Limnochordales bacterium]